MPRPHRPIELTQTLEKVNVPSIIADRQGTITWLNDAAKKAFGDLLGKPFGTVVVPEDVPVVHRQLDRKLRGARVTDYEIEVFTSDGRRRRAEVSSVPIQGGDQCHAIFGIALPGAVRAPSASQVRLTARQMEILRLLGDGSSTNQIAASLHLSKETVRNHVRHILRALGAHSRLEAVAFAHRQGLLGED
ncbi:MAG: LuxR C-terminal-related transcriptional regulator [Actinomycetota bacterium]|nr:LuxR C-terminal-related transcriptional regulator [Actinomycetota bacterium]